MVIKELVCKEKRKKYIYGRIRLSKEWVGKEVAILDWDEYSRLISKLKNLVKFLSSLDSSSKMFDIVTKTWNPVTGCLHNCVYCWARRLAETKLKMFRRYRDGFKPRLNTEEFNKSFKSGDFVFVTDMGDLFGSFIPDSWIYRVLDFVKRFKDCYFLFLTKNPERYFDFLDHFPPNVFLGCTIETDIDTGYNEISKAPPPSLRIKAMKKLDWPLKFISIEPILKFSSDFAKHIVEINPLVVYVGYDNYGYNLPSPPLSDTLKLINNLLDEGILVFKKNLRGVSYGFSQATFRDFEIP